MMASKFTCQPSLSLSLSFSLSLSLSSNVNANANSHSHSNSHSNVRSLVSVLFSFVGLQSFRVEIALVGHKVARLLAI